MQTLIMIWTAINTLLPLLVQSVKVIEDMFPASGMGAQKLEMVRSTLEKAYAASGEMHVAFEQIWPTLNAVINSIVALQKLVPVQPAQQ